MKRLLAAVSPLALLCALPAFAANLPATPATLWAQLGAAQPSDHVQLTSGDYGDIAAWNFTKAGPGVTIEPAPGAAVKISSINAAGSTNLTFTGFDVTMTPTTQYGLIAGSGGSNIVFDHMKVHQADNATLKGTGVLVQKGSNITFNNGEVSWVGMGLAIIDSDHVEISNNPVHDIGGDGINLAGSSTVTVSNNLLHDLGSARDGGHPDTVQFFGTTAHPVPAHLTITGNEYDRNAGAIAQGIFGGPATDVEVSNNALRGAMTNGIAFAGVKGGVISGNFVQGYPDMGTQIGIRGASDSIKVLNNTTQGYSDYAGDGANTNITVSGTVKIPAASSPADATAYNIWKATQTTVAAPPPVGVTPPAINPLQATVDSLTAQVASLKAQLAAAQTATTAAQGQVTSLTGQNATLTSQLQTATALNATQASQIATLKAQLATAQASLTAATAKITKAQADLN